jgi:outer membrane protein
MNGGRRNRMQLNITRLALLLALVASPCLADGTGGQTGESRWRLGAAVGYGLRSNPLVQSDDIPIVVDLDIAWFGDHVFFDNGDLGVTFADNERLTASLVARVNSDRVFFGRTDSRFFTVDAIGMPLAQPVEFKPPDRDYAIELGIEMLSDGPWGALQFTAFHDVSGTHGGYELYADYSYGWRNRRLYIEPSLGAGYKSADLNNYYWGVTEDEAGVVVLPYQAGSGVNWHARLMVGYQLTRHWALSLVAEYERLNGEAAASPIVEEDNVLGWFAGVSFRF